MFKHFRGDWAYAEPNFFDKLSKNFFSQNLHFGPIRWVPGRFLKILIIYSQNLHFSSVFLTIFRKKITACICWAYAATILSHAEHTRNKFHRTLSIRGTNFRACSAYGKMWIVFTCTIHAQHTRNEFHRMLSIRGTDFIACWACAEMFKSQISRPNWIRFSKISCAGPWDHMVSVSAKKVKKKIFMLVYLYNIIKFLFLFCRNSVPMPFCVPTASLDSTRSFLLWA